MTYEQYWHGDPALVRAYHRAKQLQTQDESTMMWLQGKYFYDALCAGLANFSAGMAGKRGNAKYPKDPYRVIPKTKEELEAERQAKLNAYIEELKIYAANFNKNKENRNV